MSGGAVLPWLWLCEGGHECGSVCVCVGGWRVASGSLFSGWHLSQGFEAGDKRQASSSSSTLSGSETICLLFGKCQRQLVGTGVSFRTTCSLSAELGRGTGSWGDCQGNMTRLGVGSQMDAYHLPHQQLNFMKAYFTSLLLVKFFLS